MKIKIFFLGISFVLLWSSAFSIAKISILYAPPLLILSLRFFLSFLICYTIIVFQNKKFNFSQKEFLLIIIFGFFQNTIYLGFNFLSLSWVKAGLVVTINSLVPIIVVFLLFLIYRQKVSNLSFLGLFLGLLGIIGILINIEKNNFEFLGILFCLLATISISLATIIIKDMTSGKFLEIICIQMLIGFLTITPISAFYEKWYIDFDKDLILSFLFLIIGPGIIANYLWLKMINDLGASKASSFHFLNPILGLFAAYIFLAEKILILNFISVLIISIGILCIQYKKSF